MLRERPAVDRHAEARRALERPGCPACRAVGRSEQRWISAFAYEHYRDADVLAGLARARGFCPAHTRLLWAQSTAPWVTASCYDYVLRSLAKAIATGRRPRRPAECPLCASLEIMAASVCGAVVAALGDPAIAGLYRDGGGFCRRHLPLGLRAVAPSASDLLVAVFTDRLTDASSTDALLGRQLLLLLAGTDSDVARRQAWRECATRDGVTTAAAVGPDGRYGEEELSRPGCIACRAGVASEGAQLARVLALSPERPALPATLCPTHLHDLCAQEEDACTPVLREASARLEGGLRRRPSASRWHVGDAVRLGDDCPVCAALKTAEDSALSVLSTTLANPSAARAYEDGDGLCARHVLTRAGAQPLTLRVLGVRLRVLAWELEEAGRKASWAARHERPGPERTAWVRAPAQLDGRVTLAGLPLPPP